MEIKRTFSGFQSSSESSKDGSSSFSESAKVVVTNSVRLRILMLSFFVYSGLFYFKIQRKNVKRKLLLTQRIVYFENKFLFLH